MRAALLVVMLLSGCFFAREPCERIDDCSEGACVSGFCAPVEECEPSPGEIRILPSCDGPFTDLAEAVARAGPGEELLLAAHEDELQFFELTETLFLERRVRGVVGDLPLIGGQLSPLIELEAGAALEAVSVFGFGDVGLHVTGVGAELREVVVVGGSVDVVAGSLDVVDSFFADNQGNALSCNSATLTIEGLTIGGEVGTWMFIDGCTASISGAVLSSTIPALPPGEFRIRVTGGSSVSFSESSFDAGQASKVLSFDGDETSLGFFGQNFAPHGGADLFMEIEGDAVGPLAFEGLIEGIEDWPTILLSRVADYEIEVAPLELVNSSADCSIDEATPLRYTLRSTTRIVENGAQLCVGPTPPP